MLRVLGIESSCDETGAAVVDSDGNVLSDVVHSQIETHSPYGGIIPELASRDHVSNVTHVVRQALDQAGLRPSDVDGIAVTNRPGLVGALLVGVQVAKAMAWGSSRPVVGVDHLVGHLLSAFLRRPSTPESAIPSFPFVALLVSGGHTALYRVDGTAPEAIRELGATRDDAAGEAFDKVGKLLGLGYPAGPVIDRLARGGNPKAFEFVVPMAHSKTLEFSFSGLKTQVAQHIAKHGVPSDESGLADLCASFQSRVATALTKKLIAAAKLEGVSDIVLGGGVAANRELREKVVLAAGEAGLRPCIPPIASCTDNAAMIAYAGACSLVAGHRDDWTLSASSRTSLERATRKGRGVR